MGRVIVMFLVFAGAVPAEADDRAPVTLDVKPLLCIIDRRTPVCEMDFLIAWQSVVEGYYCLFRHYADGPLRCWNEAGAGRHEERRIVDKSFQYWVTGDSTDEPLAAVTVEVMTTETTDRRRNRRTRHVWDIL